MDQQQNGEAILPCTQCNSEDAPHFTYKTKTGALKHFPKCKKCHNLGKYQKKPTGFAKLPEETQVAIRNMLEAKLSLRTIAAAQKLSYMNLKRWIGNDEHL